MIQMPAQGTFFKPVYELYILCTRAPVILTPTLLQKPEYPSNNLKISLNLKPQTLTLLPKLQTFPEVSGGDRADRDRGASPASFPEPSGRG